MFVVKVYYYVENIQNCKITKNKKCHKGDIEVV